jgi:hypothetical protein
MPYLGDFLGHLISEVTVSRAQADAEAIRLAELYQRDPILKHMPVPRFRLPNMTLRVPVAVTGMEDPAPGDPPRGKLDLVKARAAFWRVFDGELQRAKLVLPEKARSAAVKAVERVFKSPQATDDASVSRLALSATEAALDVLRRAEGGEEREALARLEARQAEMRETLVAELVRLRQPPPRLRVAVTATELREAGPALVNLELQVSEEAMEWTLVQDGDGSSPRLVPE